MLLKHLNRILPVVGVGVASCALMKTIEVGHAWSAAFNALFLLYSAAVTFSRMK